MDKLLEVIENKLQAKTYKVTLKVPFARGDIPSTLKDKYADAVLNYLEDGISLDVTLDEPDYRRYAEYTIT